MDRVVLRTFVKERESFLEFWTMKSGKHAKIAYDYTIAYLIFALYTVEFKQ